MKLRFLGTGTSTGVPQIGCDCRVCVSKDPRDRRRRCGAYVTGADGAAFLIDTSPDLRDACLEYGIRKVDAVLLTHAHMDHVAGFDDIRRFNTINGRRVECDPASPGANGRTFRIEGAPLECYATPETVGMMHHIFPYVSDRAGEKGLFRPQVVFKDATKPFAVGGISVESFPVEHGFPCCGFLMSEGAKRIGYASDCHDIPDAAVEKLRGADIVVLDCLRAREHPTHLSLSRAAEYFRRISPGRGYITHMCHDLSHQDWLEALPRGIEPAYDGLEVEL